MSVIGGHCHGVKLPSWRTGWNRDGSCEHTTFWRCYGAVLMNVTVTGHVNWPYVCLLLLLLTAYVSMVGQARIGKGFALSPTFCRRGAVRSERHVSPTLEARQERRERMKNKKRHHRHPPSACFTPRKSHNSCFLSISFQYFPQYLHTWKVWKKPLKIYIHEMFIQWRMKMI